MPLQTNLPFREKKKANNDKKSNRTPNDKLYNGLGFISLSFASLLFTC